MNVDDVLPTASGLADALSDADGQAIAVQTVSDRHSQVWLLSGRVKTLPEDEPSIAAIDPSRLWTWGLNERDVEDKTEWLRGRMMVRLETSSGDSKTTTRCGQC